MGERFKTRLAGHGQETHGTIELPWSTKPLRKLFAGEKVEGGKSAINLSNLGKFCQIWPRAIIYVRPVGGPENYLC